MHICYFCFSENTENLGPHFDFGASLYTCKECGLTQTVFVSSLYLSNYYECQYRTAHKETINDEYLRFMSSRAQSQHEFILRHLVTADTPKNVLDIGASVGALLRTFSPGSALFANEQDAAMLEYLKRDKAITLIEYPEIFHKENYSKFDLIMLSHVFEHLPNPLEYLYYLHKLTSKGGHVFLEVPNEPIRVVSHYRKKHRRGLAHLFHYTVSTLIAMIAKSGLFEVVNLTTYSVSVDEYLRGASIMRWDENPTGDGIHIRCLLKQVPQKGSMQVYSYIDSVLQDCYRRELISVRNKQKTLESVDRLFTTLLKAKERLDAC
jgi:2-polyprenyl-3-methyl-5-hydroxy-6-metoxy-1,4-benzoquinol methylase